MGTTLSTTNLTVTVSEQLVSNGQIFNYQNQLVVPNIKPFDPRVMTIPLTEVPIIDFADEVGAGTFITENMRYLRIANKDDTNWIRVRLKKIFSNQIATLGSITAGSKYLNGTYNNVILTGGTGSGATATILVNGSGIYALGTITAGTGYVNGTYTSVPLTGGSGSGALATIVVSGTSVTSVTISTVGTGYTVGNVLSASNTNLGGSGSGFSIPVSTLAGGVTAVTLVNAGTEYTNGDSLTAPSSVLGTLGSGFSIPVSTVQTVVDIFDTKVDAGNFLIIGSTDISVSDTDSSFSSFVNIASISAEADTAPVDIEYFIASV